MPEGEGFEVAGEGDPSDTTTPTETILTAVLPARYLACLTHWLLTRLPPAISRIQAEKLVDQCSRRVLLSSGDPILSQAAALLSIRAELNRELASILKDRPPSVLEQAIGREAVAHFDAALARLTEQERVAVVGRIEWKLSYAELAVLLPGSRIAAAREAVTAALMRAAEEMTRGTRG